MTDAIILPRPLADYVRSATVRESALLRRLREESEARADASMLTSPEQSQFLALIARMLGARRCLEIGVYTGYTTIRLAEAMPEDGRVVACDFSDDIVAIARRYWREAGVEHKIDLRIAPALRTLDTLLDEGLAATFDFVYIDAEKVEYLEYFERSLALARRGGVIAADNVLRRGYVADPGVEEPGAQVIRVFNERLRDDPRVVSALLPMRDGLTLALKL